ncbi:MAG: hypothetical protein ABSH09_23920 [Bryobacteraceae bacterium]
MAAVAAILRAVARMVGRDLRSLDAVHGNNFFWILMLMAYQQPSSAIFLGLMLRKIPPDRLALWPLTKTKRFALRAGSLALSPIFWIAAALFIWTAQPGPAASVILLAVGVQIIAWLLKRVVSNLPARNLPRLIPQFPGWLGRLFTKDFRQMLHTLDPYIALLLALSGALYRFLASAPTPEAFPILAVMVAVALSTYAQSLFGLDGENGLMRYRLMPLRGWQIFLSKDLAFLAVLALLELPLDLRTGITAGLMALAMGRHQSLQPSKPQLRWRLTSGALFPTGLIQVVAMVSVSAAVNGSSAWYFAGALLVYGAALWWYGRVWDKGTIA